SVIAVVEPIPWAGGRLNVWHLALRAASVIAVVEPIPWAGRHWTWQRSAFQVAVVFLVKCAARRCAEWGHIPRALSAKCVTRSGLLPPIRQPYGLSGYHRALRESFLAGVGYCALGAMAIDGAERAKHDGCGGNHSKARPNRFADHEKSSKLGSWGTGLAKV